MSSAEWILTLLIHPSVDLPAGGEIFQAVDELSHIRVAAHQAFSASTDLVSSLNIWKPMTVNNCMASEERGPDTP